MPANRKGPLQAHFWFQSILAGKARSYKSWEKLNEF